MTAGPTRAYLDRVRYLSNYSSGQLGYEICRQLEKRCEVIAVVGPCGAPFHKLKATRVISVETVDEMCRSVLEVCAKENPKFAILAAAVLDFAPKKIESGKVSSRKSWQIDLVPTPKIIDKITRRFPKIRKVAFKLEWKSLNLNQMKKFAINNMKQKSAEALCINFFSQISGESHPAFLFTADGKYKEAKNKKEIAAWIRDYILSSE